MIRCRTRLAAPGAGGWFPLPPRGGKGRPLSRTAVPGAGEGAGGRYFTAARWTVRVAALATAFNEAVTISLSIPAP